MAFFVICGFEHCIANLYYIPAGLFSLLGALLSGVWALAVLVPGLALVWRRLHDIGKSGIWILIALVPLVGMILLLVWFCKDSQPGMNQYGPNPKGF